MAALEPPPDLERRCRRRAGRCARRTAAQVARPDGTSTLAVAAVGARGGAGHSHRARLFLARDPCVQFLYLLVGIKFIEARDARDGTLLICLALFLSLTQFFYLQTITAALSAVSCPRPLRGTVPSLRSSVAPARSPLRPPIAAQSPPHPDG